MNVAHISGWLRNILYLSVLLVQHLSAQKPEEELAKLFAVTSDTNNVYIEAYYELFAKNQPKVAEETLCVRMYLQGSERYAYYLDYVSVVSKEVALFLDKERKILSVSKNKANVGQTLPSPADIAKSFSGSGVKVVLLPAKQGQSKQGIRVTMLNAAYRSMEIWYEPGNYKINEMILVTNQWNESAGEFVVGDTIKIRYRKWQNLLPAQKRTLSEFVLKEGGKWTAAPAYKSFRLISN